MFNGKTYVDDNGEIIWDQKIKESIRKTFNYHQFNVVRQTIEQHGKLFNDTIQPHSDRYKLIPLKTNRDPAIYGGYNNDNNAYSVVLDVDGKKKINGIPIRIANQLKSDELDLSSWLENNIKHKKPMTILIDKVPKYQRIINEETGDLLITSANEVINNVQLFLPSMYTALISLLDSTKTEMYSKLLSNYEANILIDIYDYLLTKLKNNYPLYRKEWAKLAEHRDDFIESDLVTQASTLQQLIKFMHADPSNVNLKFGNFKGNRFGRKNGNIKLSKTDFIYESPTGLFKSIKHID
nr:Cas9 endonuclease PAM-interacting domain-containing protein [Companilactobacillus versmoldensis]